MIIYPKDGKKNPVPATQECEAPKAKEEVKFGEATEKQRAKFCEEAVVRSYRDHPSVLIVEDQAFSGLLLRSMLHRRHEVFNSENALNAWELYLEHAPDVCFCDIQLPDISGHEFAKAIMAFDPKAYIVMVTASNLETDIKSALDNQAKGFIVKPYSTTQIMAVLQKYEAHRNTNNTNVGRR